MKKILFGLLIAATFVSKAADDSYLYWMVGSDVATSYTYDTVKVAAVDKNNNWKVNYLTLATENFDELGKTVTSTQIADANDWGAGFLADLGTYGSAYSFIVELCKDGVAVAHTTEGITWTQAQGYLVSKSAMNPGSSSSWSTAASGFTAGAIPEPTSGMMLLLGVAALALRRRRA